MEKARVTFNRQLWDEEIGPIVCIIILVVAVFTVGWAIKTYVVPSIGNAICERVVCR